jgi:hypothetical protein
MWVKKKQTEPSVEQLTKLLELNSKNNSIENVARPTDLSELTDFIKTGNKENIDRIKELLSLESLRSQLLYEQLKSMLGVYKG